MIDDGLVFGSGTGIDGYGRRKQWGSVMFVSGWCKARKKASGSGGEGREGGQRVTRRKEAKRGVGVGVERREK